MKTKRCSRARESRCHRFKVGPAGKCPGYLEYIVVLEMTSHLERGHGDCFTKLMDGALPAWRSRWNVLNKAPLTEEPWA
jgi:hypothetical protein